MARLNPNKIVPAKQVADIINAGGDGLQDIVYYGQKAYIPVILGNRVHGYKTLNRKFGPNHTDHQGKITDDQDLGSFTVQEYPKEAPTRPAEAVQYITIVDIDYEGSDDSKRYFRRLDLPFVPREVNYTPDSNFVGIASMGRNTPHYHFTGAEDTLEFTVDWFSDKESRDDVIFNCRWMEALSKNDGYDGRPHRIQIVWGSDDKLWQNDTWLLVAAPYKLRNFNRGYKDSSGNFVSTSMLPMQAYQQCTFKRVSTSNRTSKDIISNIGKPSVQPVTSFNTPKFNTNTI